FQNIPRLPLSTLFPYTTLFRSNLKVAHCSDAVCSSATTATIDTGNIGGFTSIAIGSDGLGVVTYETPQTALGPIKVAHCANVARSEEHTSELQSRGQLVCRLLL